MTRISTFLTVAASLWLSTSVELQADIVLSFASAGPFTAGNSGTVDLLIHRDSNPTAALDGFVVNVSLTATGGSPVNGLQFAAQTDSQLADTDYVFFGRSNSQFNSTFISTATSTTTLTGADLSDDGGGGSNPFTLVDFATNPNQLLLRMDIFAALAGTYDIAVELLGPGLPTDFQDDTFTSIPFTSTPMSITVNAATAVPEPATGFVCGLIAVSAVIWKRRRRLTPDAVEV